LKSAEQKGDAMQRHVPKIFMAISPAQEHEDRYAHGAVSRSSSLDWKRVHLAQSHDKKNSKFQAELALGLSLANADDIPTTSARKARAPLHAFDTVSDSREVDQEIIRWYNQKLQQSRLGKKTPDGTYAERMSPMKKQCGKSGDSI
jgi:hypothetical protein